MTKFEDILNRLTNTQLKEFINYKNSLKVVDGEDAIDKTVRNYISGCLSFEEYLVHLYKLDKEGLRDFKILDMTINDVSSYQEYLINIKQIKESTANQKVVCLSSFFKTALKEMNLTKTNDEEEHLKALIETLKGRKITESNRRLFTKSELILLNKYIVNSTITHRERLLAIFLLLRDTFCQRVAIVNIKLSDLFLDEDIPYIVISPQANVEPVRFNLKPDTVIALKSYLLVREDCECEYLFISNRNTQIDSATVYLLFKQIFIGAGFGYLDADNEMKTDYSLDTLRLSFRENY